MKVEYFLKLDGPNTYLVSSFPISANQVLNSVLQVIKVRTNDHWADIFTKPLSHVKFQCLHLLLMGW